MAAGGTGGWQGTPSSDRQRDSRATRAGRRRLCGMAGVSRESGGWSWGHGCPGDTGGPRGRASTEPLASAGTLIRAHVELGKLRPFGV